MNRTQLEWWQLPLWFLYRTPVALALSWWIVDILPSHGTAPTRILVVLAVYLTLAAIY